MPNELKVVSYNILDVELESNFVPRNMNQICIDAIAKKFGQTPKKLKANLSELYIPFFRGFEDIGGNTISKSESRKLWGQLEAYSNTIKNNGKDIIVKNLMQILIDTVGNEANDGSSTATELYNIIAEYNFPWLEGRLQRVYDKIIKDDPDIICVQEYGNCKNLSEQQSGGSDVNNSFNSNTNISTDKNQQFPTGSLPDMITSKNYNYQLFSYNPEKGNGDDGVAIFYKGNKFDLQQKVYVNMDETNQVIYKEKYKTQRGCGLLKLKIRENGQDVIICTTHIQTTSNEKVDGDKYAIRKGELNFIKEFIKDQKFNEQYGSKNDMVIFCGDLNLDLNNNGDKAVIDEFEQGFLTRIKKNSSDDDLGLVTSYPSGRKEYIDYFFTNCGGVVTGDYKLKSELTETIPNKDSEPSDHIPILLTIGLPATITPIYKTNGGKRQRKPKRKTKRKSQQKSKRKSRRNTRKSKK
jgi:exonuclease III